MRKSKVALLGTEYHSAKIEQELKAMGIEATYERINVSILSYIKLLIRYDYYFITYGRSSYKFIFMFLLPLFLLRRKVYIEWIGSDVIDLRKFYSKCRARLISKLATNLCECDWIQRELRELSVDSKVGPYITFSSLFNTEKEKETLPGKLIVTTYAPKGNERLYNLDLIIDTFKGQSDMELNVVAHDGENFDKSDSVKFHGWLDKSDLNNLYDNTDVFVRMTSHDGLSYSVLEAMSRKMQVIFTYDYPNTNRVSTKDDLAEILKKYVNKKKNGEDIINHKGSDFIKDNFVNSKLSENNLKSLFSN
ncbi:glycosyltransferase [Vibrio sp. CUB2]|uniref:glycosyltransferase n=1 Tax=Vibrio sp. CUB2 TaxID=2315233 RepID=UPI000769A6DD|nr:glycosyltransferase [Vibrio sp. CUB2]